jgi:hypothetical protein
MAKKNTSVGKPHSVQRLLALKDSDGTNSFVFSAASPENRAIVVCSVLAQCKKCWPDTITITFVL